MLLTPLLKCVWKYRAIAGYKISYDLSVMSSPSLMCRACRKIPLWEKKRFANVFQ